MMHDAWCTRHTWGCIHNVTQMKGQTQEGDALTVLPIEWTHRGGTHPQCNPMNRHTQVGDTPTVFTKRTDTQTGTHPQCNPANGHTNFFGRNKLTHKAIYWGSMLPKKLSYINFCEPRLAKYQFRNFLILKSYSIIEIFCELSKYQ